MTTSRIAAAGFGLICAAYLTSPARGQTGWQTSGNPVNTIYAPPGINVGIGTASPVGRLTLRQAYDSQSGGAAGLRIENANGSSITQLLTGSDAGTYLFNGTGNNYLMIHSAGNVGIGTTTPQHKLSVNGTIGAKEVIVTNTGWPDYVFRPGYRLRPLSEVAAYIRANRHLPDIPSDAEVKAHGVSVGEMQAKLLAKIEELTLHMIREHERNDWLEKQNQELRDEIRKIKERIAR